MFRPTTMRSGALNLAGKRRISGFSISRFPRNRINNTTRRYFAKDEKAAPEIVKPPPGTPKGTAQSPPPPPPPSGGGGGMWILLTAALIGGGYYFKDEIAEYTGWGKKVAEDKGQEEKDTLVKNVEETKKTIRDAEARLKAAAQEGANKASELANKAKTNADKAVVKVEEAITTATADTSAKADWKGIRGEIVDRLENLDYDDGSYGPLLVRLAWHNAGTYDKNTKKGGTEGAAMRFEPESAWGANAGLEVARTFLEPIKEKHPEVTYSDLWSFAGTVALEEMGAPEMKWRGGRKDCKEGENVLPDGLLPDADGRDYKEKPQDHVREIFGRMGFNDQEMVALIGAHVLGRGHMDRSGYWGPWTRSPTTFSNDFFKVLLSEKWNKKTSHENSAWNGPEEYVDETGEIMMLPTDMCLLWDEKFKKYVDLYAKDEDKFMKDFAKAWLKLQELGVRRFHAWPKYIFFGPRE